MVFDIYFIKWLQYLFTWTCWGLKRKIPVIIILILSVQCTWLLWYKCERFCLEAKRISAKYWRVYNTTLIFRDVNRMSILLINKHVTVQYCDAQKKKNSQTKNIKAFRWHWGLDLLCVNISIIWRRHHYLWRYSLGLNSGGSLACHTFCDTGHPFKMVISEDFWHSHLLPAVTN